MDDLAFEGVHRLQVHRLAGFARLVDGIQRKVVQALALALQIAVHVHDEVGPLAGLLLYGESGELLQGVHDFAVASDQMFDVGVVVGNDLHGRTVVAHAHFDIALVVDDVKQSFKVIGSDVSFVIELIDGFLSILRHGVLLL